MKALISTVTHYITATQKPLFKRYNNTVASGVGRTTRAAGTRLGVHTTQPRDNDKAIPPKHTRTVIRRACVALAVELRTETFAIFAMGCRAQFGRFTTSKNK